MVCAVETNNMLNFHMEYVSMLVARNSATFYRQNEETEYNKN